METLAYKICLSVLCAGILISTSCYGHPGKSDKHVALFIFGDSLYDPGNNNYINTSTEFQADFSPYGETFFRYPTGRFSDGRLICDFIAEYAKLPLIPAFSKPGNHQYMYGVNFASGGAGALVESNQGWVIDLKTQLSSFKNVVKALRNKLGDKEAEELLFRAVYLFSAGGNDYISPLVRNPSILRSYTRSQYIDMVIGNFTSVIKGVYNLGGRKFGFLSLPPLGCLPSLKAIKPAGELGECYKEATVRTELHNGAFPKVLQKLESQLKGFKYAYGDLYTYVSDLINKPSRYGFREGKIACCGSGPYNGVYSCGGKRGVEEYELCSNPSEYVFFDSSHPSERAYQVFAELYWSGTPNGTAPYNLEALFEHQAHVGLMALFLNPISSHAYQSKPKAKHVALFVFGDSLFDPGNNQYLNSTFKGAETSWPYGETFFKHPTGRISDGRIVPDFIAEFAKLPILPPYLQPSGHRFTDGSNFASGGAGVLVDTHPGSINLRMQLSYFKEVEKWLKQKLGNVEAKEKLKRAVYLFSIGGNDYFGFYTNNPNASLISQQQYVKTVIGNLTEVLQEIYDMGGRKVGFQNAGPLGCVPVMKANDPKIGSGCAKGLSVLAQLHNKALSEVLEKFESQLQGFQYSIFDYYHSLLERVNHPSKYGFKEGKAACFGCGLYRGSMCGVGNVTAKYELCSDPGEYVWFDGGHTTERANLQLAKLIWKGVPSVTGPRDLKQLFGRV